MIYMSHPEFLRSPSNIFLQGLQGGVPLAWGMGLCPISLFFCAASGGAKKLGWQTRSEQGLFQGGEIGQWITAEAKQTATALVSIVEGLTQGTPSGDIGKLQVSRADGVELTDPSSHHAYGAAHHQGW